MSVVIRHIRASDKPSWKQLWCGKEDSYLKFYKSLEKVTPEATIVLFDRLLDEKEPIHGIVAEADGQVIGFAHYLTHRSTWTIEDAMYLNDLYVSQKSRLGGIGRQLIEYVYSEADKYGCKKCYWCTDYFNHRAQLLYTKVGVKNDKVMYLRPTT